MQMTVTITHEPERIDSPHALAPPARGAAPDWDLICTVSSVFDDMAACMQKPIYHAEGDVLTHTRMVVGALLEDPLYWSLGEDAREDLYRAAILHDIGKPSRHRDETAGLGDATPGHAERGGPMAVRILEDLGFPAERCARVGELVCHHMLPPRLTRRDDRRALALEIDGRLDWHHLFILSRADLNGRIAQDIARMHRFLDDARALVSGLTGRAL